MAGQPRKNSKRNLLIQKGIEELNRYGIAGFSIRRVADDCGVSCGAPYKHFGNKNGFITAIVEYVNQTWFDAQKEIVANCQGNTRQQLVEISVNYEKFLVENPHFRSILMLKDDSLDTVSHNMRGQLSFTSRSLVEKYCDEVGMPADVKARKLYVVRALIYGAALMMDNGELEYNETNLDYVRFNIDREFDLL